MCVMFGVRLNSLIAVEGVVGAEKVDKGGEKVVGYYTYGMRKVSERDGESWCGWKRMLTDGHPVWGYRDIR